MFKHALVEGFKNLTRSFWLSATAVTVLTVSLGSFAFVTTLSTIVGFSVRQLDNQIAVVAYFKEDIKQEEVQLTLENLKKVPEIKQVEYVNREQAQKRLQDSSAAANNLFEIFQNSDISFGLEFVEVTPRSTESYGKVDDLLRSAEYRSYFFEVQSTRDFIKNLQTLYDWIRIGGVTAITIFGIISILVMANILRIAIYSFRDEIEIMRLVGATNSYIRSPFIAEGAYFNIIAAVIVLSFFVPVLNTFLPDIMKYIGIKQISDINILLVQIYSSLAITIFSGIAVGVVTSYAATQKYLGQ